MTTYDVHTTTIAHHVITVEADSPKEAGEKGEAEAYVSLCHQCAHDVDLGDFEVDTVSDPATGEEWPQ